jgi:hypothetical protein
MGIVKKGMAKGISGKVGGYVYSQQKDGTTTVSEVQDFSNRIFSIKQLSAQQDTKVCGDFLKVFKDFTEVGYALQAQKLGMNTNNAMKSHLQADALVGEYPNRFIDLTKVLVTKGSLPPPEDVTVEINDNGLAFTWNPEVNEEFGTHYSDQIAMVAYFPELGKLRHMPSGAQRHAGKDLLMLTGIEKGYVAEVYIAFMTNTKKGISDSVYLGQFNW